MTKYFGAEVGALTNWDEKESRYIVNGVHDADKLQTLLDGFIKKFVLCPKCDNPETVLSVKNGIVFRTCKACGAKNPCDNMHKLATYIKTNPPPKPVKLKQAKDTAAANIQQTTSTEENIEGMVAPEGFDDGLANAVVNVDEDDWDEDAAQANREAELASLSQKVKESLSLDNEPQEDPLETFAKVCETRLASSQLKAEELLEEAKKLGIKSHYAVAVATQVLLETDPIKRIQSMASTFTGLVRSEKDSAAFLGSLERIASSSASRAKLVPALLQAAYMSDIVDEEILKAWRESPSKKYVSKDVAKAIREEAEPFFAWLEEDSDDDEETDSDE